MQSSHPACYNSVVVLLSGRQRYKAVVFVVYCCIGSASKYDNFLNAQRRGRDQFRVLQCCSAAVCMLQVAVMINAVQFNNPVMLHTGNMWGVYNRTLHTGNTPAPCPQAAHGCTLQCALQCQCAPIRWHPARCYCAYLHSTATFCRSTCPQE